jgi:hypothetical protein
LGILYIIYLISGFSRVYFILYLGGNKMSYQIKVTDVGFEDHFFVINTLEDIKISKDGDGLYRKSLIEEGILDSLSRNEIQEKIAEWIEQYDFDPAEVGYNDF